MDGKELREGRPKVQVGGYEKGERVCGSAAKARVFTLEALLDDTEGRRAWVE